MSCKNWRKYTIEEATETIIDYRGKTPKKVCSGIPLITAKIIKNGRINVPEEYIREEEYEKWMVRGFPKYGDVLLTTEAPLGEVAQLLTHEKVALAQRVITLRGKKGIVDDTYLKYYLQSPVGQNALRSRETGTTVTGIKQSELRKVEILTPEYRIQVEIGSILKSLDDKIELNLQMNKTLEAIAQAIFKEWFVDFRYPGAHINNYSSKWPTRKLGEVISVWGGSTPSTTNPDYWNGNNYWVTPKDLANLQSPVLLTTERRISDMGVKQISSGILPAGTLLLSSRAPIGYLAISQIPISINQGFIAIQGKLVSNLFMLFWIKRNMNIIKGRANGSTFQEISKSNFKDIEIILPSPEILQQFDKTIGPFCDRIISNCIENRSLLQIRDLLLPRLISGALTINGFDNEILVN